MSRDNVLMIVAIVLETIAGILRKLSGGVKEMGLMAAMESRVKVRVEKLMAEDEPGPDELVFDGESLRWRDHSWPAKSGPHGKGQLPPGVYRLGWKHCAEGSGLSGAYRIGDVAFWIPLVNPLEVTGRGGFGIHPDGNVPGTLGCVGIQPAEAADPAKHAREFWELMTSIPTADRPQVMRWVPCWENGECPA